MELKGHSVTTATTLAAAVPALLAEQTDVLITDIGLPDGDGRSLLAQIPETSRPFGIAMSGYGTLADRERSRVAGFHHHLTKPFDPEELDRLLAVATQSRPSNGS